MFRRQIEVIGKENQEKLSQKSVLVVGCGGLGNSIATIISCIGLKKIYLIDYDTIEMHNIHRQFQFCKADIGKSKVIMLSEKLKKRGCDTDIEVIEGMFSSDSDIDIDLIFDATDNFEVRLLIDEFAKKKNIPWIYASVEEEVGQAGVFKQTPFSVFATKKHEVKGQLPPMVSLIGSISAMLGMKVLTGKHDEIFYFVDFKEDLEIKKFKL